MITLTTISERELLEKIKDGVSKTAIWKKPLLLLTKNSDDYNYMSDTISERHKTRNINHINPERCKFTRVNNNLEAILDSVTLDAHNPDVDIYEYLGSPKGYDEKTLRYCAGLVEYEAKPVICFFCIADKNCAVENIPSWAEEVIEIKMLKLNY